MSKQKSSATIAKRLASQTWGEVQRQTKVGKGIWLYSTAGHGGFVADIQIHPTLERWKETVYITSQSNYIYDSEQHFAPFEEDCQYAIIIWLYGNEILKKLYKHYNTTVPLDEWINSQIENTKKSLLRYNPDVLTEFPEPYMGITI